MGHVVCVEREINRHRICMLYAQQGAIAHQIKARSTIMATKKELLAELKALKSKAAALEANDEPNLGTFGGIVARDNVVNTEK